MTTSRWSNIFYLSWTYISSLPRDWFFIFILRANRFICIGVRDVFVYIHYAWILSNELNFEALNKILMLMITFDSIWLDRFKQGITKCVLAFRVGETVLFLIILTQETIGLSWLLSHRVQALSWFHIILSQIPILFTNFELEMSMSKLFNLLGIWGWIILIVVHECSLELLEVKDLVFSSLEAWTSFDLPTVLNKWECLWLLVDHSNLFD